MIKLMTATLALGLPAVASAASAATLDEADSLYSRNQVAASAEQYRALAADPKVDSDTRSIAERELGRIAWLIDGDAPAALKHLAAARTLGGPKACGAADTLARVLQESGRNDQAIEDEAHLLSACDDPGRKDAIRVRLIKARLDLAAAHPDRRKALLAQATNEGAQLSDEAGVEGARVRLETALLTDQPQAALRAWQDYFWLDDSDAPQALQKLGVTAIFNEGLAPNGTADDRLVLADLLMRAGFFEQSRRYALAHGLPGDRASDPRWKKLEAYWHFRDTFDPLMLKINRGLAHGAKNPASLAAATPVLNQAAKEQMGALVAATGATGDPQAIMKREYGLIGSVGTTSGYPSVHLGHLIEDRDETVIQYGHGAKIHFMAIDNMIANGFESWLWDGGPMVGGWSADDVIVHVRPGYVQSPLRSFKLTSDSEARRKLIADQPRKAAEDSAKLKARPVATLEGLNDRLQMQYVDQIGAAARSKGGSDADVRRNFLAEYSRANLDQSIIKHEGRHAIDAVLAGKAKVDQPVLEYDAKLSELALTAYPRMALRNMDLNLEGDGPHDKAGAKIFDQYRQWIEAHHDQVIGYDPAVAALAQLDKLTDGQIREIARGLDRLSRGDVSFPPGL